MAQSDEGIPGPILSFFLKVLRLYLLNFSFVVVASFFLGNAWERGKFKGKRRVVMNIQVQQSEGGHLLAPASAVGAVCVTTCVTIHWDSAWAARTHADDAGTCAALSSRPSRARRHSSSASLEDTGRVAVRDTAGAVSR
jgi:hypothetical protein